MRIAEFEKQIQDLYDERLNIRINPNADDIAGVYLGDEYLGVAVPPHQIFEESNADHCDINKVPYRTIDQALEVIKYKYERKN